MAKINLPLLSQIAKNKLGDVVFFRRGDFGINIARLRVIPNNPKTAKQQAVRNNLKVLSGIWAGTRNAAGQTLYKWDGTNWTAITIASTETFTDTERTAWKDYTYTTKTGGYKVTGRLAFVGMNMNRLYNNLNPLKTPTTEFTLAP